MAGIYYHVAKTGLDSNTGLSFVQAFLTINKLMTVLGSGDIATFYDGTWQESNALNNTITGGTVSDPTIFQVANGAQTIILGVTDDLYIFRLSNDPYVHIISGAGLLIIDGNGDGVSTTQGIKNDTIRFSGTASNCLVSGVEIRNANRQNAVQANSFVASAGIFIQDSTCTNTIIEDCYIHHIGQNVYIDSVELVNQTHAVYVRASNTLVKNCRVETIPYGFGLHAYSTSQVNDDNIFDGNFIRDIAFGGIIMSAGDRQIARNNRVTECGTDGIIIQYTSPSDCQIIQNTIEGVGRWGIRLGSDATGSLIKNNSITNSVSAAYQDDSTGAVFLDNYTGGAPL